MRKKKKEIFVLNTQREMTKAELKKVDVDDFREQVKQHIVLIFTKGELSLFERGEQVLSSHFNQGLKLTNDDGMLIIELAKLKTRKFSLPFRKTINNFLEVKKLKSLY